MSVLTQEQVNAKYGSKAIYVKEFTAALPLFSTSVETDSVPITIGTGTKSGKCYATMMIGNNVVSLSLAGSVYDELEAMLADAPKGASQIVTGLISEQTPRPKEMVQSTIDYVTENYGSARLEQYNYCIDNNQVRLALVGLEVD